jgi:hypothetical protein
MAQVITAPNSGASPKTPAKPAVPVAVTTTKPTAAPIKPAPEFTAAETRWMNNLIAAGVPLTQNEKTQIKNLLSIPDSSLTEAFDLIRTFSSFQTRFGGFDTAYSSGAVSNVREYKALEKSYKTKMSEYLYDAAPTFSTNANIADLINKSVSVSEVGDRLALAYNLHAAAPAAYKRALNEAGVTIGYQIAFLVDPEKGAALANQASADFMRQIDISTRAAQKGINISDAQSKLISDQIASDFTGYSATQVDAEIARRTRIAEGRAQTDTRLSGFDNTAYNSFEALNADVANNTDATLLSKKRAERERARFGGTSGIQQGSLNVRRDL